jgi:hypothetical protein
VRACLGNTRALLHGAVAKPFFISMAHDPRRAMGHEVTPSPPLRRGTVQSRWTRVYARALLGDEAGSGAEGCVVAPEPS